MTIQEMQTRALEVAAKYRQKNQAAGHGQWDASAYMAGFVGDIGDLSKLVMAKQNFRHADNIDQKLTHELGDCLWSILVLADQLGIDPELAFGTTMSELDARLKG